MDTPELVALYISGTINADTFVWKDGMEDWLTPFEIPKIASALRARGIAPPEEAPEPVRARQPSGIWHEPGDWNELLRAPGTQGDPAGSGAATVPKTAPQAEDFSAPDEPAPTVDGSKDFEDAATVLRSAVSHPAKTNEEAAVAMASPFSAESALLSTKGGAPLHTPSAPHSPSAPHVLHSPSAPHVLHSSSAPHALHTPSPLHSPSAPHALHTPSPLHSHDGGPPRGRLPSITGEGPLTGARNESSVLFSLEALARPAPPKPEKRAEPEDLFPLEPEAAPAVPPARGAFGSIADEQLVSAFTVASKPQAPVAAAPPPIPVPAPPHHPDVRTAAGPSNRAWLWVLLVVLVFVVAGLAVAAFWILHPGSMNAKASPTQPSALPSQPIAAPARAAALPGVTARANAAAAPNASARAGARPPTAPAPRAPEPARATAKSPAASPRPATATLPPTAPHPARPVTAAKTP